MPVQSTGRAALGLRPDRRTALPCWTPDSDYPDWEPVRPINDCSDFADPESKEVGLFRRHLFASEQQALEIEYESLADSQQQQRVLIFLGVDADQTLQASTHKINPGPLDQLISNYADLRKQLAGSDFEKDFDECASDDPEKNSIQGTQILRD